MGKWHTPGWDMGSQVFVCKPWQALLFDGKVLYVVTGCTFYERVHGKIFTIWLPQFVHLPCNLLISLLLLHFASSMSLFLSVSATSAAPGAWTHQSFPSFSPPVSVSSPDPSVLGHFPPASVPLSAPCPLKTYRTSLSELGSALTKPTSMPSATETGIWNLQRKNSLDHFLIINSNSRVTVCCYLCRTS